MRHRIREFRQAKHLTQEEMAKQMDLSKGYIYQIEAGKQEVSNRFVCDVCRIFGANESWLRTGKGPMFEPVGDEEELTQWASRILKSEPKSFRRRFVRALMDLNDDDWIAFERFISNIKETPDD